MLDGILANLKKTGRVALVGTPGVGKTQTAAKCAADNAQNYRHIFWLPADNLLALQAGYAALAATAVDPAWKNETDLERAARAALDWLNQQSDWLLVLDNADDLSALRSEWLPRKGAGHLLVTTRNPAVVGRVTPVITVNKMSVEDGAECLLRCAAIATPTSKQRSAAEEISHAMDGLPLALDQAGAYIVNTGCGIARYRDLFLGKHRGKLLNARGVELAGDERTVFSTFSLAVERVTARHPAAIELLRLCAFFAPDDIPEFLFTRRPAALEEPLGWVAADPVAWDEMLAAIRGVALIERAENEVFSIHRLLLDVLRETMDGEQQKQYATRSVEILLNAQPPTGDFVYWNILDQLQSHQLICVVYAEQLHIERMAVAALLNQTAFHLGSRAAFDEAEPLLRRALEPVMNLRLCF